MVEQRHPTSPRGWYPDPLGRYQYRYFNGVSWTADVASGGHRYVDPFGITAGPGHDGHRSTQVGTVGIVCGVGAVLTAWIPFAVVIGLPLALVALVVGLRSRRRDTTSRSTWAAGLGALALVMAIAGVSLTTAAVREVEAFVSPEAHEESTARCVPGDDEVRVEGTVTNTSSTTTTFTVFVKADLGSAATGSFDSERIDVVELRDVAPGASSRWETDWPLSDPIRRCDTTIVIRGPIPFGVHLDD